METKAKIITSLLELYAKGFEYFDTKKISSCYIFPCTIWHHNNHIFTKSDLEDNLNLLLTKYKSINVNKILFKILDITYFSNNICQVHVSWSLYNEINMVISTFEALYSTLIINTQAKIFNVININEE